MSTSTLSSLLDYLYGTLTPDNMRWVGEHLIEHAQKEENELLRPFTMEEINAMLDVAERESAAGLGQDSENMFREMEEEYIREELKMSETL